MKKNLTELVFILDRSGSMQGMEGDTIGGFNAMIEKQKKEPGEAYVSTVLFDDQTEVLHDRVTLEKVQPITDKEYDVRGCTALLDAIGGAICHIGNIHKYARSEDVPEHTLFVITTDGMENASRRYSAQKVKEMIRRHAGLQMKYKSELTAMREMRKHVAWYTAGYPHSAQLRAAVNEVQSMEELEQLLEGWN